MNNPKIIYNQPEYSTIFTKEHQENALKTALDTRKFEIEMYWKRATYFWAFIAATFAAYFLLLTSDKAIQIKGFTIVVSAIGYFFSLGWYFVNRGSKLWQSNWERHVDFLESEIQGPLFAYIKIPEHKFKKLSGEYPFSVSKINQLLSFMMVVFWFSTFIFSIFYCFNKLWINNAWQIYYLLTTILIFATALILASCIFKKQSQSFLKEWYDSLSEDEKKGSFISKK